MDLSHFYHALPLLLILLFGVAAIIGDLFFKACTRYITYYIVQVGMFSTLLFTIYLLPQPMFLSFNGLYIDDLVTRILTLFIVGSAGICFWYSKNYVESHAMAFSEYYILALFSVLGMLVLVGAHSLLTIYLGLELLSLPLYALVALKRDDGIASEAAMKYFVMGAVASGILLYGLSLFYGATGKLDLAYLANAISEAPSHELLLRFALVFIITGFGFKLASVPFHMWAPDVYTGAPTSVTLFLGTAPKLAAFGMVVRLLTLAFPGLHAAWQPVLIVLAILSMAFGNLFAIAQTNIKRMLAYSAIAHIGYMFLGFIAGTPEGYAASLFYMLNYVLMSLASFGLLTIVSRNHVEIETIDQLRGLSARAPLLAFLFLITLFSLAGIPPTVGFLAKLFVLKALISVNLVWLAALALAFAVIGAFFYIRIIKVMYFEEADSDPVAFNCTLDHSILLSLNVAALIGLGIFPGSLLHACQMAMGG